MTTTTMNIVIRPDGSLRCLYDETLDLTLLGKLEIRRGSHVEPDEAGRWWADLCPVSGPKLGPFDRRSEALTAERDWLERNWLQPAAASPTVSDEVR
jgi:hypothetical protein